MSDHSRPELESIPELADADESALRGLLTRAHQPPRMRAAARSAILERLKERRAELAPGAPIAPEAPIALKTGLKTRRPAIRFGAWAAALAAAALLVLWLRGATQPVMHHNDGLAPRVVAFADGTRMVLDSGARVLERRARELELVEGRALFDVAPGAAYVLASSEGRVVGAGARFVVSHEGGATTAAVARGRVKAMSNAGEASLGAGDQAVLRSGRVPAAKPARRLSYLAAWARETLAAERPPEVQPIRRGNLMARIPDSTVEWPLPMRALTVDVVIEDGVVRTTFDHTFFNARNRNLEGVYTFSLPSDAAVSRLGMYVNGTLMEGGIVERDRGRNIYEDIVYRRRDPALLEWMSGNELKVRIFPLPARSEKRVLMSYTQVLERLYDTQRLVVPIPEIDAPVGKVTYRLRVADGADYLISSTSHPLTVTSEGTDRVATFEASDHVIGQDLVVSLREEEPASALVRTFEDDEHRYLLTRAQPELRSVRGSREPQDWVVLYDTSASRSPATLVAQEHMLIRLVTELDTQDRFAVVAFDATQRVMPGGLHRVHEFDPGELAAFLANEGRDNVGFTDLGAALSAAAAVFEARPEGQRPSSNILYVGDGVPTAGKLELSELAALAEGHRFVGLGIGDRADGSALRGLADATGGVFAKVTASDDLSWSAFDLIAELNTPRLGAVSARVLAADGKEIPGEVHVDVQATSGEDVTLVARFPKDAAPAQVLLTGTVEGAAWSRQISLAQGEGGAKYLPRLWARRHVDALFRADRKGNATEITALGMESFLVTPYTSLLVLETEADYAKHKVVRPSPNRWARYEAPAKIDVVREPLPEPVIPFGAVVLRRPVGTGTGTGYGFGGGGVALSDFAMRGVLDTTVVDVPLSRDFGLNLRGRLGAAVLPRRQSFGPKLRGGEEVPFQQRWARSKRLADGDLLRGNTGKRQPTADEPAFVDSRLAYDGYFMPETIVVDETGTWMEADKNGFVVGHPRVFDDLSSLVPQLFADEIDVEREAARRASNEGKTGAVSQDARALLDAAERAPARYRLPTGGEIGVTKTGFVISQTTPMGLRETLSFDGARMVGSYPEILLRTERDAEGGQMAALSRHAAFVTPTAAQLAVHYEVRLVGTRTLRISSIGAGEATTLELDAEGRVVRWQRGTTHITVSWESDGVTLTVDGGEPLKLGRVDTPAAALPAIDDSWTTVSLPLRELASTKKELEETARGSVAWRRALRQVLATEAASSIASWAHIEAIVVEGGTPTRGELVLASGGLRGGAEPMLEKLDDPVADYLGDVLRFRKGAKAFAPSSEAGPLLSSVRAYRRLWSTYSSYGELSELYAELAATAARPQALLAALAHVGRYAGAEHLDAFVGELDMLAQEPTVHLQAELRAAQRLLWNGRHADAATRFERTLTNADARGIYLDASQLRQSRFAAAGGPDAFRRWMLARRDRLVHVATPEALVAAASMLDRWGEPDDLEVLMNVVRRTDVTDASAAYQLASILHRRGFIADADRLVRAHTQSGPEAPAMLLLASQIAESDNRHAEAAALVRDAMDRREAMPLGELRSLYRRRFQLQLAHARALSLPHIEDALAVAAEWRREDPDNSEIDKLSFGALTARGDHLGAFRHLSSIIERHPGEGSAYDEVAAALRGQGRLVEAELMIRRAIAVEPTNPNWLLRHGELLEALGKPDAARAVWTKVADGKWQERFAPQVMDAKRRLLR